MTFEQIMEKAKEGSEKRIAVAGAQIPESCRQSAKRQRKGLQYRC